MLWRVRLWLFNLALIWKSVTPLLLNFGFTPFHMAWLNSLHNCSTRVCWWCQLSYHIQIILIHMVTWILAFSLYLDIVDCLQVWTWETFTNNLLRENQHKSPGFWLQQYRYLEWYLNVYTWVKSNQECIWTLDRIPRPESIFTLWRCWWLVRAARWR